MRFAQKLSTATFATASFLSLAIPAFADTNVNPCPGTLTGVCDTGFNIQKFVGDALSYLFVFGAIIALIFLIWGGIRWIMSGGDKAKVEAARGTIIGAIIGLVIVFASYIIIFFVLDALFGIKLNQLNLPKITG